MARRWPFLNDMSAGEIAPDYVARSDATVRNRALKRAENVRLLSGGGAVRRPGTRDVVGLAADTRLESTGYGAEATLLLFSEAFFENRDLTGASIDTVASCPWTEADLRTMQVAVEASRAVVASNNFFPQVLTRAGTSWTLSDFIFRDGLNGTLKQPYYRFVDLDVSIAPSGYNGSISVVASDPVFVAAHVGARIRYTGVEILITGFTDSTHVTGDVVGSLYPTLDVVITSTAGFLQGQEVQGLDSLIRGVVYGVTGPTTLTVQLTGGYTPFNATEKLVGPTASSAMVSATQSATPAPTVDWDEALISDARGYPSVASLHKNRLLLAGFPQATNVLAGSATGDITSFDVGTGADTDAIVEVIGKDSTLKITQFGSAEQLLIFTENGVYYIPEQVGAPLSPTNLELLRIGPEVAGTPIPILVAEGMLFSEGDSGRLLAAIPTGNVRRSWDVADLSELAYHLMEVPVELEIMPAVRGRDRLVFTLREDGVLIAMTYRRSEDNPAFARWTTDGDWRSIVVANGSLYLVGRRTVNGVDTYRLEIMDDDMYGDGLVRLATTATPVTAFANQTVSVWAGAAYLGEFAVDGSGLLQGISSDYTNIDVGFNAGVTLETMPPIDGEFGLKGYLRLVRVTADVIATAAFKINGHGKSGFAQPDLGGDLPLFNGQLTFGTMGHAKDRTCVLTQDYGAPLNLRSLTMEVTS